MADALDILRKHAFQKRIHGIPGGNRILWGEKDFVDIYNRSESLKIEQIITPLHQTETKLLNAADIDKAALAKMGVELRSAIGPEDHPLACITTPDKILLVIPTTRPISIPPIF
jgi:hypothetical protein